jgi:hypothetical protein
VQQQQKAGCRYPESKELTSRWLINKVFAQIYTLVHWNIALIDKTIGSRFKMPRTGTCMRLGYTSTSLSGFEISTVALYALLITL